MAASRYLGCFKAATNQIPILKAEDTPDVASCISFCQQQQQPLNSGMLAGVTLQPNGSKSPLFSSSSSSSSSKSTGIQPIACSCFSDTSILSQLMDPTCSPCIDAFCGSTGLQTTSYAVYVLANVVAGQNNADVISTAATTPTSAGVILQAQPTSIESTTNAPGIHITFKSTFGTNQATATTTPATTLTAQGIAALYNSTTRSATQPRATMTNLVSIVNSTATSSASNSSTITSSTSLAGPTSGLATIETSIMMMMMMSSNNNTAMTESGAGGGDNGMISPPLIFAVTVIAGIVVALVCIVLPVWYFYHRNYYYAKKHHRLSDSNNSEISAYGALDNYRVMLEGAATGQTRMSRSDMTRIYKTNLTSSPKLGEDNVSYYVQAPSHETSDTNSSIISIQEPPSTLTNTTTPTTPSPIHKTHPPKITINPPPDLILHDIFFTPTLSSPATVRAYTASPSPSNPQEFNMRIQTLANLVQGSIPSPSLASESDGGRRSSSDSSSGEDSRRASGALIGGGGSSSRRSQVQLVNSTLQREQSRWISFLSGSIDDEGDEGVDDGDGSDQETAVLGTFTRRYNDESIGIEPVGGE